MAYAFYDYVNHGHYPHELASLPLHERAMVMAFIDKDIDNRKREDQKMKSAGRRR